MNINKIGGISGKYSPMDFPKFEKGGQAFNDSIQISQEARSKINLEKSLELVKNAPDIRTDKVESSKKSLEGYFTNGELNAEITDKIAKQVLKDISEGLV